MLVLLILLRRLKQSQNTLTALTAEEKQRKTQVLGYLLPIVRKALRWGEKRDKHTLLTAYLTFNHPPQLRIADCTLYIGLFIGQKD